MKLKVCGMNLNTAEVAELRPDYLGFIFWEPSSRFFEGKMPELPIHIKRVGVFVNESITQVISKIHDYGLSSIQLHGNESPTYCIDLKQKLTASNFEDKTVDIIKVFSIKNEFDFNNLIPFEDVCDYYLFDTKGELPGGNGYVFNWATLKNYPSKKPYFLSGGIGLKDIDKVKEFMKAPESKYCYAIDVNSKFELKPGFKKINELELFKKML